MDGPQPEIIMPPENPLTIVEMSGQLTRSIRAYSLASTKEGEADLGRLAAFNKIADLIETAVLQATQKYGNLANLHCPLVVTTDVGPIDVTSVLEPEDVQAILRQIVPQKTDSTDTPRANISLQRTAQYSTLLPQVFLAINPPRPEGQVITGSTLTLIGKDAELP